MKNKEQIKKQILVELDRHYDIPLTLLSDRIVGREDLNNGMFLPVKLGNNENVLLCSNTSENFIRAFNDLQQNKIIDWNPCHLMILLMDNAPIYDMPLATEWKVKKGKKHCFMPMLIVRGEKFPDIVNSKKQETVK